MEKQLRAMDRSDQGFQSQTDLGLNSGSVLIAVPIIV